MISATETVWIILEEFPSRFAGQSPLLYGVSGNFGPLLNQFSLNHQASPDHKSGDE